MMSQQQSHAFADSDALASPYASYSSSFSLFHDEHDSSSNAASLSLSMPFASPPHPPAAPLPRRPSTTLFRLSPTFSNESYYYQWNDSLGHAAAAGAGNARSMSPPPLPLTEEMHGFKLSPVESSITPSISITSAASSTASYASSPSTPDPSSGSPTPSPSPNPLPRHSLSVSVRPTVSRQRSATLGSSGDRVLRKRRRQRECDIQRRQKENVGFNRLYMLLTAGSIKKQQKLIQQQQMADDEEDDDTDRKMNKADILHQSAERIEQLERMLTELTEAHTRRNSLESSIFTHSSACIVVIHVPSGVITDASERYLQHTLMERSWVVGRRFFPPLHLMQANPLYLTRPYPSSPHQGDRVLCKTEDGVLQETVQSPQCEKSLRLLEQLYSGEIDTMCAVWRSQFGDGRIMEKAVHSWVTEWEEHEDGTRIPLYVIGLVSTSETVCVE